MALVQAACRARRGFGLRVSGSQCTVWGVGLGYRVQGCVGLQFSVPAAEQGVTEFPAIEDTHRPSGEGGAAPRIGLWNACLKMAPHRSCSLGCRIGLSVAKEWVLDGEDGHLPRSVTEPSRTSPPVPTFQCITG